MIYISNLTIGYKTGKGEVAIAKGLDGEFRQGELTCLLGRNGMGKSTLLNTIAGFLPPLSGTVTLCGRNITDYTISERARMISLVLTENTAVSGMRVFDLVAMGRSPYTGFWGRLSPEDRVRVTSSLQMVGMNEYADREVQTLSDGERQKVLIAKAIAQETPVIILDEPTAFLDYPSKVSTIRLLRDLAHNLDKTIILTTHDLDQALAIADRFWLMDKTLGLTIGTGEELKQSGTLDRYFDFSSIV